MSITKDKNQTAYKDTPIGKIPADWEVKGLGEITNIYVGRDHPPKRTTQKMADAAVAYGEDEVEGV